MIILSVNLGPRIVENLSADKLVHYVGDSATFTGCQFVSNFTNGISVSWLKDGVIVDNATTFASSWNSNSFLITVKSLSLSIIEFADSGNYSCQLKYNTAASVEIVESSRISLLVQSMFLTALYYLFFSVYSLVKFTHSNSILKFNMSREI